MSLAGFSLTKKTEVSVDEADSVHVTETQTVVVVEEDAPPWHVESKGPGKDIKLELKMTLDLINNQLVLLERSNFTDDPILERSYSLMQIAQDNIRRYLNDKEPLCSATT
jgi:hypothetical protein